MLSSQFSISYHKMGRPHKSVVGDAESGEHSRFSSDGLASTEFYHTDKDGGVDSAVTVHHYPAEGHTSMPPAAMTRPGSDTGGWSDAEFSMNYPGEIPGQMAAFHHQSSKAYSQVYGMGSTKGGRVSALTSLGMAAQQAQNMGHELKPSNNLSRHSERLVGKLAEVGHTEMPEARQSNNSDFWTNSFGTPPDNARPVTQAMVEGGKRTVRSVVSRNRKQSGDQPPLF